MGRALISSDLCGLLERLDGMNQLIRVQKEVDPRFELAAVTKHIQQHSNLPVVFERVRGTPFRVASNVFGNYGLVAAILGTDLTGVAARWAGILGDTRQPAAVETDEPRSRVQEISLS